MAETEQGSVSTTSSQIQAELSKLRAAHSEAILEVEEVPEREMYWITVRPRSIAAVLTTLRDDKALDYKLLTDVTCIDRPETEKRFVVLYNLYSISRKRRLFLRAKVAEGEAVPTVSGVFTSADWAEREVTDLFGVPFEGHPDPRKIMLPDDFEGHPLRKDFPLVGRRPVILFNNIKDIM